MKAVIQRVTNASVTVGGEMISSIGLGLCVLIGMCKEDTDKDLDYIANKILNLKLYDSEEGKRWTHSVVEKQYEILCVSQFTLYHTLKGNKPSFHHAMPAPQSEQFYQKLLEILRTRYRSELIKDGKFGAMMKVNIVNDGPVTIQIESPKQSPSTTGTEETVMTKQEVLNGE